MTGKERVPLHRRMPYDPYSLVSNLRRHRLGEWLHAGHGRATWVVFEKAIAQGQASDIFRRIRDYYRRYWVRPIAFGEETN